MVLPHRKMELLHPSPRLGVPRWVRKPHVTCRLGAKVVTARAGAECYSSKNSQMSQNRTRWSDNRDPSEYWSRAHSFSRPSGPSVVFNVQEPSGRGQLPPIVGCGDGDGGDDDIDDGAIFIRVGKPTPLPLILLSPPSTCWTPI